jgi:hypothetical protein
LDRVTAASGKLHTHGLISQGTGLAAEQVGLEHTSHRLQLFEVTDVQCVADLLEVAP